MTKNEFDGILMIQASAQASLLLELADKLDLRVRVCNELGLHDYIVKAGLYSNLAIEYRHHAAYLLEKAERVVEPK